MSWTQIVSKTGLILALQLAIISLIYSLSSKKCQEGEQNVLIPHVLLFSANIHIHKRISWRKKTNPSFCMKSNEKDESTIKIVSQSTNWSINQLIVHIDMCSFCHSGHEICAICDTSMCSWIVPTTWPWLRVSSAARFKEIRMVLMIPEPKICCLSAISHLKKQNLYPQPNHIF